MLDELHRLSFQIRFIKLQSKARFEPVYIPPPLRKKSEKGPRSEKPSWSLIWARETLCSGVFT